MHNCFLRAAGAALLAGTALAVSLPGATLAAGDNAPSAPLTAPATILFEATREIGEPIALEGQVPADATRRFLAVIAGAVPATALTIGTDLPADFASTATAGIRALTALTDGHLTFDGTTWRLRGRAETAAARTAARASLAAAPAAWHTVLTLLPPRELCALKVTAFGTRNAILFQSGSARITAASAPALDELAGYLALCPAAAVHVEGHTDADGEEGANLALSVARAEAVSAALVARGVGPERLYAIGYGEGLPIAANDTRAGKQANRRIAFTIEDAE